MEPVYETFRFIIPKYPKSVDKDNSILYLLVDIFGTISALGYPTDEKYWYYWPYVGEGDITNMKVRDKRGRLIYKKCHKGSDKMWDNNFCQLVLLFFFGG